MSRFYSFEMSCGPTILTISIGLTAEYGPSLNVPNQLFLFPKFIENLPTTFSVILLANKRQGNIVLPACGGAKYLDARRPTNCRSVLNAPTAIAYAAAAV